MLRLLSIAVFTAVPFLHVIDAQKNTKYLNIPGDGDGNANLSDILVTEQTDYTICMWLGNLDQVKGYFELPLFIEQNTDSFLVGIGFYFPAKGNVSYFDMGSSYPYSCHRPFQFCGSLPQWIHICSVLLINKDPILYIDGIQQTLTVDCKSTYNGTFFEGETGLSYKFYLSTDEFKQNRSIYQINVFNRALKNNEISALAKCKSKKEGNVVAWSYLLNNIQGSFEKATGDGPCPHKPAKYFPINYGFNYKLLDTVDCDSIEPSPSISPGGSSGIPSGSDSGSSSSPSGSNLSGSDPGSSSSPSGSNPSGSDSGSSSSPSGSNPSGSDSGSSSSPSGSNPSGSNSGSSSSPSGSDSSSPSSLSGSSQNSGSNPSSGSS